MIKDYLHPLWGKSIRGLSYPDGKANDAFIDSLQQDIDNGEKDMYLAKLGAFLDTATGKWLDYWGEWLGLHRNQRNDDEYRNALKGHVLHSRNTIDAIRDAVAKYLDTNRNRIYVYEPYRDMFIYNSSNWNTYKFYPSVYYRYAVIDVKIDHPIDGVVAQIINLFRPAGVIFVITNLINVLNDKAPIIDFSLDASANVISNDFDYVGFTQNNFVVLSPSLDASLDNDEEPFTYNKDSWNGGKKYASGTYGSGLLQYASMFQTDQHIHSYSENLLDYSTLTPSYLAQASLNVEYDTGIAKNADITVTCGTNGNSKTGWGDGISFNSKSFGQDKNVPWGKWFAISGLIKADFDGAELSVDFNSFPYGKYEFGFGNDHDAISDRKQIVFNGSDDNSTLANGVWTPFYLAWYNGNPTNSYGNSEHAVLYDNTEINVKNTQGVTNAQYHVRDLYYRVVDSPDINEAWVPGSYSTLLYDSPNDKTSAEYAKQGLYDSVDTRYAKYSNVNTKPIVGYVDFLSAYSATKFNKLNIDYSGYTGTQTEKLVQALKPVSIKSLSVYAKVARNSADVTLRVFNYKLALWEIFGTYTLTPTDYTYITHDFYDLSNYVNPVTGLLTFSLLSNNDTDVYIDYYSFTLGSKTDGIYELSTAQFYDNVPLGALTSYSKVDFTDAHYPVTGTAVTDKDKLYRVKTLRTIWDSSRDLQGSGTDFKIGIPDLHQTGKTSSQSDSYMAVTYTSDNGAIAPFSTAKLGSINFDLSKADVNLAWTNNIGGVRNLVMGTAEPYVMGYEIPNTTWKDGYAYLKLPTALLGYGLEILPQPPRTFFYTLTKGKTYTQTIWFETDAKLIKNNSGQITWFTNGDKHDFQPATLVKLGKTEYKLCSTYTWPRKSDNRVRLFDSFYLTNAFDLKNTGTYLKFGKLMLEEGTVSHDWKPAPEDLGANKYVCVYQMPLFEDNKQSADLFATLTNENINIERVQVLSYFDNEVLNKDAYNYHLEQVHYNNVGSSGTVFGGIDKDNEMYIRVKKSTPNQYGVGPYYLPGFDSEAESKYATVSADVSGTGYLTRAVLEANTPPVGPYNLIKFSTRDIFVTAKGDSSFVWITPEIFPMANGETYTLSFTPSTSDVADGDTSDISKFSVRILDTKTTSKEVASLIDTADGKRHSLTFTIPNDGDNYGVYLYAGVLGSSEVASSYFTTIYHHVMLEKATLAHDWRPSVVDGEGRNLLQGTSTASGDVAEGNGTIVKGAFNGYDAVKTNGAWSEQFINLKSALGRTDAKAGDWVTISVYVKADKPVTDGILDAYRVNGGHLDSIQMSDKPITTKWQQYSWSYQINNNSLNCEDTRIEYSLDTGDNWLYWAGWMLEKGTVAHAWSPAIEDAPYNSEVRNLIRNSNVELSGKAYDFAYPTLTVDHLEPGETYTMSWYGKVDANATKHKQSLMAYVFNGNWSVYPSSNIPYMANEYQRSTFTFTVPNDATNVNMIAFYLQHYNNDTSQYPHDKDDDAGIGYVKNYMLEKGSVAHYWQPAPEDYEWSPNPMYVGLELDSDSYTSISNTFNPVVSNTNPYTLYLSDYFAKYTKSNNLLLDSPTNMVYEKHTNGSGWNSSKSWTLTLNKGKYYFIDYLYNDTTTASNDSYGLKIEASTDSGVKLLSSGSDTISLRGFGTSQFLNTGKHGWLSMFFEVPKDNTTVILHPWASYSNTGEGRIGYSHLGLYSFDSFSHDLYMDSGFINPPLLDYKYKNMKTEYGVVATNPVDRSVHESLNVNINIDYNNNSYWNNLSSYTKAGIKDPDGDTPVYTTALNKGLSTTGYMLEPNTWYKVSTWAKLPNNTGRRLAWTPYNVGYMSVWDSDTGEYSQDNMRFGGVNLLPNTDSGNVSTDADAISESQWVLESAGTATMSVVEETANKNVGKYSYTMLANNNTVNKDFGIVYPFKANTTYTATCKVRLNSNSTNASPILHIRAWDYVGNYSEAGDSMFYQDSPKLYKDRWVTISATFSTSSWKNVSNKHDLEFGIQGPGSVDFYEFQLEEGSVAHPYNPAPSDYGLASNQCLVATDSKDWFKTSALFYTGSGFEKTHIPELQMINGSGTLYQGPIFINKIKQSGENLLPSFHQIIESNNYSQRTFNEVWNVIKNSNDNAYSQSTINSDADTLFLKGGSELYINTATTSNISSYLSVRVTNNIDRDVSLVISYAGDSQKYVVKANTSIDINRSFIANGNGYSILSFKADGDLTFTNPSMVI